MKNIEINDMDTAIIFRHDGKCETYVTKIGLDENDQTPMPENEILTLALADLLKDPNFVVAVKLKFYENVSNKMVTIPEDEDEDD